MSAEPTKQAESTPKRGYVPRATVLVDCLGREEIREEDGTIIATEPDGTSQIVRRP
ncbi:hypothetical protein H0B56_13020 [Haloechinothrix sp. YIM 98757]|uniref:Uncharacterized protein n=1 Tax=Haloechinothrix aidingensis TaxID=2752311 RepID=A0A838AB79_9PSEU|nr:hypothetical protein [Haloechinothrix aidingensis]MBA0126465.1 hypothetical protein [Haloechinothrix aidingensis]